MNNFLFFFLFLHADFFFSPNLCTAPNQTRCDPGRDPAAEEEGKTTLLSSSPQNAAVIFQYSDDLTPALPPTYHHLLLLSLLPLLLLFFPTHLLLPDVQLAHAEQEKLRWRMERAQLEQNIRDSKERMEKLEGYWMEAQSLCKVKVLIVKAN